MAAKTKTTAGTRSMLSRIAMSERHARRMKSGVMESKPSDTQINQDPELVRLRDARLRLEDLRIARELGLDKDGP